MIYCVYCGGETTISEYNELQCIDTGALYSINSTKSLTEIVENPTLDGPPFKWVWNSYWRCPIDGIPMKTHDRHVYIPSFLMYTILETGCVHPVVPKLIPG